MTTSAATTEGQSLLAHIELLHERVESPSSSDVAAFYGWVRGIEEEARTRGYWLGVRDGQHRSVTTLDDTQCSGIVCIHEGCKRHSFGADLYCGEHGGPPEYVSDPGWSEE